MADDLYDMIVLLLAAIGAAAGVVLDSLAVALAKPPDDDDPGDEPLAEQDEAWSPQRPALGSELGSLVLSRQLSERAWLRRLLVVGATSGLFAAVGARFDAPSHLALITAYVSVLVLCAVTDALSFRVPNVVTYPAILGAIAVGALMPSADILAVLAGGLLAGGVLFLPALITGGKGMGMGDVKLAAFVGLALGFEFVVPAMLVMALVGGVAAAIMLVGGRRGQPMPYAPFIAAGALTAILLRGTAFATL